MSTVHLSFRVEAKYNPCPTVDWSGTHKCNSWKINQAILCKCIKALCCITHTPYLRTDTVQSLIFTIREWNNIKTYSWEKHTVDGGYVLLHCSSVGEKIITIHQEAWGGSKLLIACDSYYFQQTCCYIIKWIVNRSIDAVALHNYNCPF